MNQDQLKQLINKYLDGHASRDEIAALFQYYEDHQANTAWNAALMGEQDQIKTRLHNKITNEINQKKNKIINITRIAASIAVLISLATWLLFSRHKGEETHLLTKAAPANRTDSLRLPDGTQVVLNRGTTITYPERFAANERKITLTGEAFFDVAPQQAPFIIQAGNTITRVLGTSFNIRAYERDERIKIAVVTGKVSVQTTQAAPVLLVPGQEAIYTKNTHTISKATADPALAIAWKEGKIRFRNTPFPEAVAALSDMYNVKISYRENLKNCQLFADFNRDDKVEDILDFVSRSLNGKLSRDKDGAYWLTGPGCR
ncbi:DUF4974 domain-containing protein [Chitinophaga agrisoli]|uniref:DUF4974 domain-containing protein n=1 Tax=Chitinophaga agrisoli TaxID=2607653 RepID=A0A5B2VP47_9BACT|nr:FecR family protein [Chitinophaga agrisoli]KAA2239849.1 DUF4974 domain-containing protein [Chitinophaga agrisoli]